MKEKEFISPVKPTNNLKINIKKLFFIKIFLVYLKETIIKINKKRGLVSCNY